MLEIRLLGQFDVRRDGEPIDLPSRPAQSLLAYLCLHAPIQHRRERLSGLLWPESDESNARSNLRHALWKLGDVLGKHTFLADKLHLSLNPEAAIWVDVTEFDSETAGLDVAPLLESVKLYQGELLPGFYEDWAELERERLRSVFDRKADRLIEGLVEEGRWAAAIQWSERWIAHGHVPEAAFRWLMTAHRALGDTARVVEAYERCAAVLRDELDVEPSAETTALYQELRTSSPNTAEPPTSTRPSAGSAPGPALGQMPDWPPDELDAQDAGHTFVGRQAELDRLMGQLAHSRKGQGQIALVTGQAGSGKTSLTTAFARLALKGDRPLVVVRGGCELFTGSRSPFAPFRQALLGLMSVRPGASSAGDGHAESAAEWLAGRMKEFSPDLATSLMPGTAERAAASVGEQQSAGRWQQAADIAAAGVDTATAVHRRRIFEAYAELLAGYSAQAPILMVLEDLHWIDPSSAALLQYLAMHLDRSEVFLVGTYRPDEVTPSFDGSPHPLDAALTEIKRRFGDVWIDLEQLDSSGVRHLVSLILEAQSLEVSREFVDQLAKTTRGHPFFVIELVKDLQERGGLVLAADGLWKEASGLDLGVLPTRVEAVVEDRIARLDVELRRAMSIASIQGEEFIVEVVAEVLGVDAEAMVRRMTEELGRQLRLVEEVRSERVGSKLVTVFAFRHVLIQRYLYRKLGKGERAYLHEAVGETLESIYSASNTLPPAGALAHHFVEAGLDAKAATYLQLAGEQALRLSAYPEAIDLLQQAQARQAAQAMTDDRAGNLARAKLERLLGEAAYGMGDLAASAQHLERTAALLGFPIPNGNRWVTLSTAWGLVVQGWHLLRGIVKLRPATGLREDRREAAFAHKLLAEICLVRNETLLTLYTTVRGLNLAESSGAPAEKARAYADAAVIAPLLRVSPLGEHYKRLALEEAARTEGRAIRAYVQLSTSIYDLGEGKFDSARQSLEDANAVHSELGDWSRLGVGLMLLANFYSLRGNNRDSFSTYEDLRVLADKSGNLQHQAWGLDGMAKCQLRHGNPSDIESAAAHLGESKQLIEGEGILQEEVELLGFLAQAQWRSGKTSEALATNQQASAILERSAPNFFSQGEGYSSVVQTYLWAWEASSSPESMVRFRKLAGSALRALERLATVCPVCLPRAWIERGKYEWMLGHRRRATSVWMRALERAGGLDMPLEQALAHFELGRHGPPEDSERRQHASQAQSGFEELGMGGTWRWLVRPLPGE